MPKAENMKRMLFIINPVSGKRAALRYLPDIIRIFYDGGYLVTAMVTTKRGDAVEFAAEYADGFDILTCVGGDGTFNEVVTGLANAHISIELGYIPSGSTNDFAACHELSSDILTAARRIVEGDVTRFDIGRFDDCYFTYVAAFGAFSWLSYSTPQNLKNILGHSAYILDAVKDLSKIKAERLKITADGAKYEGSYIFGAICSSTSVAGVFELPHDVVDTGDGMFEVVLIHRPPTLLDYQNIVRAMLEQNYAASPYIDFFQAAQITVESESDHMDWSLDGEHAPSGKVTDIVNMQQFMSIRH